MEEFSDTDRLDFLIKYKCDIDAPDEEENTWVIYDNQDSFGAGIGCDRNLRKALDKAIKWKQNK